MILIPAIDLKDGHCVRLKQGDMDQATTFGEDPAAMTWLARLDLALYDGDRLAIMRKYGLWRA